jgi:hypothetical protein
VQVLEDQHGRPLGGDRLEEAPPGGEGLVAGRRRARLQPHQGQQAPRQPLAVRLAGGHGRVQLGRGLVGVSDSRMPAWALTISPSAQKVIPSP